MTFTVCWRVRRQVATVVAGCLAGMLAGCGRQQPVRAARPATAPGYEVRGSETKSTVTVPLEPAGRLEIPPNARLLGREEGMASWYGTVYDGRRGADGTIYDQNAMTAASRTLPLGALALVTNLGDGQAAVVRITDRGPFVPGRILDLSRAAAKAVGLDLAGVGRVRVEVYAGEGYREVTPRWCVQVGAFVDANDARQMRNDLQLRYPTAKVTAFNGPTGSWVRLTLQTPERSRSAQVAAAVSVPDPGVEAYLTRIN